MKVKGISPLVAAVILVALVMTIAVLFSGFLTGFVRENIFETEQETGELIDCTGMFIDIDLDSVDVDEEEDEVSFILDYKNGVNLTGIIVATYNEEGDVESDTNPEPSEIQSHVPKRVTANVTVDDPNKIRVLSEHCPGNELFIAKDNGDWTYEF